MKKLLILVTAVLLSGCDPTTRDVSGTFAIPQELKDKGCTMYRMKNEYAEAIYVLYCPNANTTTQLQAKHPANGSVINGVYYEENH
ncbi:hypothetical protein KASHIRA_02470 [Serratia phage vB_SmaM-Kashira]|nr:hypothetical protein [Acinetobacter phage ABPH49]URC22821.1 hypothetical protein KASHIRA_02470 [Serratia phage vB_SmaM-Kashira]